MNRSAIALFALIWLGACTGGTAMQAPPLPADATLPGAWEGETNGQAPADGWALRIDDPHLTTLIDLAIERNPDLSVTRARVDQARAAVAQARASLLPGVQLGAGLSERGDFDLGGDGGRGDLSITPSWEADLWGRLAMNRDAAAFSLRASSSDLAAARLSLATSVAEAYVLAIAARLQAEVAAETFERLSATLGFIEVQAERGLRSGQDIALIRADVETARASLLSTGAAERDALRALELLLGSYPALRREVAVDLPAVPAMPAAGVPADLLRRRPDLVALEHRIAAAARRVDAARADRLPSLTFTGGVTADSDAVSALFDPANVTWRVLADLSAPILDGGARRARVKARRAELAAAMAAYQGGALAAFGEVERTLDLSGVLDERERALTRARAEARQALAFVQYRFEVGDGDLLDVLAVRRQRLETYLNLTLALGGTPFFDTAAANRREG